MPSLDWTKPKDPPLSLGHASLLANLRHHNLKVTSHSWAVNRPNFNPLEVSDFILQNSCPKTDLALGVFVWNEKAVQTIVGSLKRHKFPGRIILGGPQISYVKNNIERYYPQADIFIRGYAETALIKLMQNESNHDNISGVHFAGQKDLGISATADLNLLPSPFLTGLIPKQKFIRWETQRGCPFRCAFCQHRESDIFAKRRLMPIARILQEIEWICRDSIIKDIAVLDPVFNSGPNYLQVIDKLIEGKYSGKIALQCRIEMLKDEFLEKLQKLNETAHVLLEFGLQTIHPEEQAIIDRPNNMRLIKALLQKVKSFSINCEVSLIFGLPKQTVSSFQKSIEFCKTLEIPVIRAFPLMLLRGTPLYDRKKELELIESSDLPQLDLNRLMVDIPHVISSPSFSFEDWKEMARIAESLEQNCSLLKPLAV